MDTSDLLAIFLKGTLGSRGRKRARRATSFLTGHKGFLSAGTLMGAAGVAWGIYDTLQRSGSDGVAPGAAAGAAVAQQPGIVPPIPGAASVPDAQTPVVPSEVLRIVRLAVSAARADGTLLPAERAMILGHARDAGVESVVEVELAAPRPLSEIVAGVADEAARRDLYVLAFTIVRADESVSGAERVYLAQLAHQLGLAPAVVATLESDTARQIDRAPEQP